MFITSEKPVHEEKYRLRQVNDYSHFWMSDHEYWLRVCRDSLAKSRTDQLAVVDASFGVAVRMVEFLRVLMVSCNANVADRNCLFMCPSFVSDGLADIAAVHRRHRLRDLIFLVLSIGRPRQEKTLAALRLVHRLLMLRKHLRHRCGMLSNPTRAELGRIQ